VGSRARVDESFTVLVHTAQPLEPVSKRACMLNPNKIRELIVDRDIDEFQCDKVAIKDEQVVKKVSWNCIYDHRAIIQCV
jgi:hypothetical protein